jgi:hypothetical protein
MAVSCTGAQISFHGYARRRMATTARSQPCALPISEECSHGVGVAPAGVEEQRATNGRTDRPALHPWARRASRAGATRLATRGNEAARE